MEHESAVNSGAAMSWHEKELVACLQRLSTARSRLEALEAQAGETQTTGFDPDDVERLESIHLELEEARRKASGRFGRRHADAVEALEVNERLVLDRLGVPSYDEYRRLRTEKAHTTVEVVDPVVLDFARREVVDAEAAFLELQALEVMEDEPDADASGDAGAGDDPSGDDQRTQSA